MTKVSERFARDVAAIVGDDHIRTDRVERKMYSFDIGEMPPMVRPLVPAGLAGAVTRPEDEGQLARVLQLATHEGVPVVPRAWATSGYGGVLPQEGSLIIDLSGWDAIVAVDPVGLTVTTQPSAIWEEVDRRIVHQGLELRLHPSSYPSSSVAGWLAQGGSGYGSYEYGEFVDSVVSARVMQADGLIREFEGDDLRTYVAGAEGTTGIITQVTFKVRRLEAQSIVLIAFPSAQSLVDTMVEASAAKLPLWSVTYINPTAASLKRRLPSRSHHPYEEGLLSEGKLPEAYLLTVAYPTSRAGEIEERFMRFATSHGGTRLSREAAEHEWSERTAPMRLKRIGPSIIPTEVVVPLVQMAAVLDDIDATITQDFVLEGMVAKGDDVVLLGYFPHDVRSFAFNVAFALSLAVIKIARKHGGAGYSTGLYFRNEAISVLGRERIEALRAFKRTVDPAGILNPGKVFDHGHGGAGSAGPGHGGRALDRLMGAASKMMVLMLPMANRATPPPTLGDMSKDINGIPGDAAYMATACARCGYCVHTCEQYSGRGWESQSPRGKYAYLREVVAGRERWDRTAVDRTLLCTTCEVCDDRCQLGLPVEHDWMELRGKLVGEQKMGTFPPFEMMGAALRGEGDIWAGKREHRADWLPEDVAAKLPERAKVLYFAGCTASYVENDIAESTLRLLQDSGVDVTYMGTKESCCGIPMKMAGRWDIFEEIYEKNVAAARETGATTIVTSCPACALVWKELYAELAAKRGEPYEFKVKHYSEFIAPAIKDGTLKLDNDVFAGRTFTFHDSCHAGRAQGIYEPPREMLEAIPGINYVEMEHNREEGICCGSVLTLIGEPSVAPILGERRLDEAVDVGADTVVALCPCCQVQLRASAEKAGMDLEIDDLARVVATAAGYEIPTSKHETMYQWGVFEKFIDLMQPQDMAVFMGRIFPQMVDAMGGMGTMMRGMAKMPGGPAMMAKMMPVMFPQMAPSILGKVMPDLIAEAVDYMGEMPPDMADLMPDLLPRTMDATMPTYLPELVPHLVPLFITYLRTGELPERTSGDSCSAGCSSPHAA